MDNIFSLLNINKDMLDAFKHQANLVDDRQLEKSLAASQKRLKVIEDSMLSGASIAPSDGSIEKIIERVRQEAIDSSTISNDWSFHDLRIVSYYLTLLHGNNQAFDYAIQLLDTHWRNLYFNGLVFYLLNGWLSIDSIYKEKVSSFIRKRLASYQDNNKKYLILKNHSNLFDTHGTARLAAIIQSKHEDIRNAPTHLGFRPSTISLPYYSDVIVRYFKDCTVDNIPEFEELLKVHDLNRTRKLLLANLVEQVDKDGNDFQKIQVAKFSERILGDIIRATTWAPFKGATEEEKTKLLKARSLVNAWYARKVIDVFFEKCVQDPNRKIFWSYYIPYLSDFRIVGSLAVKGLVETDPRLDGIFDQFFVQNASKKAQTSALVLKIRNSVFVEFSDLGSLYVYESAKFPCPEIFKNTNVPGTIDALKSPAFPKFIELTYSWEQPKFSKAKGKWYYKDPSICYTQGRLAHNGNWQLRVYDWIKRVLKIDPQVEEYVKEIPKDGYYSVSERFDLVSEELSNGCYIALENNAFYIVSPINGETYELRNLYYFENAKGNITVSKTNTRNKVDIAYNIGGYSQHIGTLIIEDDKITVDSGWYAYNNIFYIK